MNTNNAIRKKYCLALVVAALMAAPLAQASDINISGFLSVGGGMVDDEKSVPYDGYKEEDLTFERNLLGLQFSGQVNEKITATAQLIARSEKQYEVSAEWAYLTWQASENGKIRAGRLRTPLYMYSDSLDVGYSYPWITAPNEVYYLPFNNVDGVDYYLNAALGSFDTSLQVYFGSYESDFTFEDGTEGFASLRNQMGVVGTLGKDWWNLRAAYHQVDLTVDINNPRLALAITTIAPSFAAYPFLPSRIAVEDDKGTFVELGFNIDTGLFVAAAEHVEFEVEDSVLAKNIRSYAMVGVRLGDFLIHVTGSKSDDEVADLAAGIPVAPATETLIASLEGIADTRKIKRDVLGVGVRWDVTSGTALKLQLDNVDDLEGDQKVLSVALQAVF
jgi:Gram-negative porin